MAHYMVSFTVEEWYTLVIEADSEREALDKFHDGDYDHRDALNTGGELQDSVVVEVME